MVGSETLEARQGEGARMQAEGRLAYGGAPINPMTRSGGQRGKLRMSIAMKLVGCLFGLALLMAGLGVFSLIQMGKINDAGTAVSHNWLPSAQYLDAAGDGVNEFRVQQFTHNLVTTDAAMQPIERKLVDIKRQVEDD